MYRMVVLPAASRPTYNTSFVRFGYPGDTRQSTSNCIPSKYLQKTDICEFRSEEMTREYNHVRISFLPRRAVKSLEIERPIVGVER